MGKMRTIQKEIGMWVTANFNGHYKQLDTDSFYLCAHQPLLGMVEELGELSHAHLKVEQGIRTNEDHEAARKDAIGDLLIYLLDYCGVHDLDAEEILEQTWGAVKKRNWKQNPSDGTE